ncbi:MAG: hypothetical protein HN534_02380 [Euryarchaeota archaeon]|jgi:hypothetical protein|nr:hypothetical protein [Euryarchaeota archaeon]MBT3653764.1 hypothetical protein [Euryarchaeota archaeon]MBT3757761.1 hypothetical protein [Euryarchaeota archaeon]MBT4051165.1 hypothetical protein [Euryarchaeota archaeon]MBT4347173.1 hypothetical protein [Euryarchaeota archaeon]
MSEGETSSSSPGYRRLNLFISAWACLVIGTGIILYSESSPLLLAFAIPIAIAGIILLLIALRLPDEEDVDPAEIAAWEPDATILPEAGRVMYRIDTTLVEPIRTSILCGRCGNLEWVEGGKPKFFDCIICDVKLWEEDE